MIEKKNSPLRRFYPKLFAIISPQLRACRLLIGKIGGPEIIKFKFPVRSAFHTRVILIKVAFSPARGGPSGFIEIIVFKYVLYIPHKKINFSLQL